MTTASAKQLDAAAHEFNQVRRRFEALEAAVDDARWGLRPSESEWSVGECIAHLNLTSAAMMPRLRTAFDEARALPPVGERGYSHSTLGWILAKTVGPAPRLAGVTLGRVRTAPAFVPGADAPRDDVVAEFRQWRNDEEALLRDAGGLQIDRVKIESPFRAGTYYDGWSALIILARHELRHIVQAERVLDALEAT
jgi:hypothetical protein